MGAYQPQNVGIIPARDRSGYTGRRDRVPRAAKLRDALTGEWLVDADGHLNPRCGRLFVRVRPDARMNLRPHQLSAEIRPEHYDPAYAYSYPPVDLHTQEPDGALGGCRYGPDFARYLARVLPQVVEAADHEDLREWWHSPYAFDRVRRGFVRHFTQFVRVGAPRQTDPERHAEHATRVVFAALTDPDDVDRLLAEAHLSYGGLQRWTHLALTFAFRWARDESRGAQAVSA